MVFQARSTAQDSFGGQLETWGPVATVKVEINALSGRELIAAAETRSEISHRITVRWCRALSDPSAVASMRIVYGSRIFNIHAQMNIAETNKTLVLLASEGLNNG